MKRPTIFLLLGLFIAAFLISLSLSGTVGQALASPVLNLWNRLMTLLNILWASQDQFLLWSSLIVTGFFMALEIVLHLSLQKTEPQETPPSHNGRVKTWQDHLSLMEEGGYFHWRFSQQISPLLLERASNQTGRTIQELREALKAGQETDIPPKVAEYIRAANTPNIHKYYSTQKPDPRYDPILHLSPRDLVQYLENHSRK
jgi:hypothetical protein